MEKMNMNNVIQQQDLTTLYSEAKQWIECLKSLTTVLDAFTAMVGTSSENGTASRAATAENDYLCHRINEREVRQCINEFMDMCPRNRYLVRFKYQWYALYQQFVTRGWIAGEQYLVRFCQQMNEWFPNARVPFDYKGVVKGGENTHRQPYQQFAQQLKEEFDKSNRFLR